ncbi:MAG: hypothetical protein ACI4EF_01390, partial [Coprococcus sp.]
MTEGEVTTLHREQIKFEESMVIKMIDKSSTYEERIMDALAEDVKFSDKELKICEDYLYGNKGQETLQELSFRDLSSLTRGKMYYLMGELEDKKQNILLDKAFNILFATGQVTIGNLMPYWLKNKLIGISDDEASKKIAIESKITSEVQLDYYRAHIDKMVNFSQKNADVFKEALKYQENPKGQVILMSVYFLEKYTDRTAACVEILPQDKDLMEKYEELVINKFANYDQNDVFQFGAGISYLNYQLSDKLKDVLATCIKKNVKDALWAINKVSMDSIMDIINTYHDLETEFDVPAEAIIRMLSEYGTRRSDVLAELVKESPESYLKAMENSRITTKDFMYDLLKKNNEKVYNEQVERDIKNGLSKEKENRIYAVLDRKKNIAAAKAYLSGDFTIEQLLKNENENTASHLNSGESAAITNFCERYHDEELCRRCEVYAWVSLSTGYLRELIIENNRIKVDKVKKLFNDLNVEKLDIYHQVMGLEAIPYIEPDEKKNTFIEIAAEIFTGYLKERKDEVIDAFSKADKTGELVGLKVMGKEAAEYKQEILKYAKESNKMIQEELINICAEHPEWEEDIKNLLKASKAPERELAVKIYIKWLDKDISCKELFDQALEVEKNSKVRKLLENALVMINEKAFDSGALSKEDLVEELHKGNKKRNLEWAYSTPFSPVHKISGEEASEEYLQAIFLSYDSMKTYGVSKNAELLAEDLNPEEFAVYVNELFDKWLEAGAEAKKRWVLYVSAIHGGIDIVKKLKFNIQEWPQNARGAIAAEAIQALALNPIPEALLFVDGASRKFKNKQVKNAAGKALEFAASQLGLTTEELADRIVPDLGFDENMERIFDYGERK